MNEQKIFDKLSVSGMTLAGVCGLMGNLYAESALNPKNLQNTYEKHLGYTDETYTQAVDSGAYRNFITDQAGYGLAQWTYYSRKEALLNFARERGCSIGDLDMQLDFLLHELRTSYPAVWKTLCMADSVRDASDAVMLQFERPADTSETARAKREAFGQRYFEQFSQAAPETPPMPEQSCDCGCECCSGNTPTATQRTHTVVSGDTLTAIANKYGTSVQAILAANQGSYPGMTADFIKVGWILKV